MVGISIGADGGQGAMRGKKWAELRSSSICAGTMNQGLISKLGSTFSKSWLCALGYGIPPPQASILSPVKCGEDSPPRLALKAVGNTHKAFGRCQRNGNRK